MRKSGWRDAQAKRVYGTTFHPVPAAPTQFEDVLRDAGVTLAEAPKSQAVRQWVKKWHRSRYVPEDVLEAIGISHNSLFM